MAVVDDVLGVFVARYEEQKAQPRYCLSLCRCCVGVLSLGAMTVVRARQRE